MAGEKFIKGIYRNDKESSYIQQLPKIINQNYNVIQDIIPNTYNVILYIIPNYSNFALTIFYIIEITLFNSVSI